MSSAPAILLSNLTRTFRVIRPAAPTMTGRVRAFFAPQTDTVVAVDRLSLRIEPGERVAFIGPNGAGKSTTLKMLSGILHPDAGDAVVLGRVPWRDRRALAFDIGTVFGQRSQLWYQLPPRETFALLAHVYDVAPAVHRRRLDALVEMFGIGPWIDTPVRQLSLGQRMRADLVASLLHAPRMLFLDEPTIGLDVSAKASIRALLRAQSDETGATLVLTSHDTGDIERVCDRAVLIHRGRLLWDGSIRDLRRRYVTRRRVTFWSDAERLTLALPGVRLLSAEPYHTEVELAPNTTPVGALVDAALRQGPLRDLTIEDAPLDDVIREVYATADAGGPS